MSSASRGHPDSSRAAREEESDSSSDWSRRSKELRPTGIADINPADRKMMRLWNLHMTKYHGYGIKNMDNIVLEFVTNKKAEILQHNLYVNFVTHLVNLHKCGVIRTRTILSAANIIQTFIVGAGSTKSWSAQCPDVSSNSPGSLRR